MYVKNKKVRIFYFEISKTINERGKIKVFVF